MRPMLGRERRLAMAHVITDRDTSASPERVIGALTDFSSKRLYLWPNLAPKYFKVESSAATSAEVTEGSAGFGGVWERSRYDWSRPGTVRIDVQDSNAFEPGSSWVYEVTPKPGGGSHVHMEFDRRPRNFKGRVLGTLLTIAGKQVFGKSLGETLRRLETQPS
jgi:hypothetical protein